MLSDLLNGSRIPPNTLPSPAPDPGIAAEEDALEVDGIAPHMECVVALGGESIGVVSNDILGAEKAAKEETTPRDGDPGEVVVLNAE